MAWLATDKDGSEWIYGKYKPYRERFVSDVWVWFSDGEPIHLPKGSIKKLIGKNLTWDDEPVELVNYNN